MKKTSVTFEVTETKTEVTAVGSKGTIEKFDITGTELEKEFTYLLRKLQEFRTTNEIVKALDFSKWHEVTP